jgi:hypothetical protein
LVVIAGPRRRPLRSGARQHPRPPAMLDGAPFGIASGGQRDSHCIRPAADTRTRGPGCSPPSWPSIGDHSLRGPVDNANSTPVRQGCHKQRWSLVGDVVAATGAVRRESRVEYTR